ncbi:hypothetical protein PHLCEN_2v13358 [Hermanssonia centrifuga]|uniref:Uncharacterized protein n=1 Tax=Hermanssonia centrifuga TaxID=98765 RepID=A0A2R6NER0_9APHY|nr:hypothetical protein PHLCEN_2v13358 [Hermanssonia centrifuga]
MKVLLTLVSFVGGIISHTQIPPLVPLKPTISSLTEVNLRGWSGDGITLPGALDIEYNPSGAECYGLSASSMVSWIKDFSTTYHSTTGVYPVIYTTTDWWTTCTGNSASFASTNPLWVARYASAVGTLPAGWAYVVSLCQGATAKLRHAADMRRFGRTQIPGPTLETKTFLTATLLV